MLERPVNIGSLRVEAPQAFSKTHLAALRNGKADEVRLEALSSIAAGQRVVC